MSTFMKLIRWTACIPVGLIGGFAVCNIAYLLVMLLLDFSWLTATCGCFGVGMLLSVSVYRCGMKVAPDREALSRSLMLFANWLLLFSAAIDFTVVCLRIPTEEPELFDSISLGWESIMFAVGMAAGVWKVFVWEDDETKAAESPQTAFSWDAPVGSDKSAA